MGRFEYANGNRYVGSWEHGASLVACVRACLRVQPGCCGMKFSLIVTWATVRFKVLTRTCLCQCVRRCVCAVTVLSFAQTRRVDLECSRGVTRMCTLVNGKTTRCGATAAFALGVSAYESLNDCSQQVDARCIFLYEHIYFQDRQLVLVSTASVCIDNQPDIYGTAYAHVQISKSGSSSIKLTHGTLFAHLFYLEYFYARTLIYRIDMLSTEYGNAYAHALRDRVCTSACIFRTELSLSFSLSLSLPFLAR
jgi:hypothetical protein